MTARRGSSRTNLLHIAALTLAAAFSFCVAVTQGKELLLQGPTDRLTPESRERAIECGRTGPTCAIAPYLLCNGEGVPFEVRLITPFSRVAEAVVEAEAGRKPLGRMGPAAVNRWGIGLSVYPAPKSAAADSIQQVFIQNEGRLVQPNGATVGPFTSDAGDGTSKSMTRGFFAFPASAFDGSSAITIILVGSAGQTSCTVDRAQLESLR
jgi:hypothetical protein